jgi:hypothetical protein
MTGGANRPRRAAPFAWLAILFLVGSAAAWGKEENGSMQGVQFTLTPRAESWVAGARVVLDMKVENGGKAELAFPNPMFPTSPQPTYTLERPDGKTATFTPATGADVEPGPMTLVRLPPRSAWAGELVLDDLRAAGRYTLTGTIEWEGLRVASPPATFEVAAAHFEALALGLSRAADGGGSAEALVLQRSAGGARTLAGLLHEKDPTLGEMPVEDLRDRGAVPADATAVLGPYANYETSRDPLEWVVCRTPRGLWIGNSLGAPPVERTADAGMGDVATPLAVDGHHLILVGLLAPGKDGASHLGFATVGEPKDAPAKRAFAAVHTFPGRPVAIAAALGPEAQGSQVVAGAVLPTDQGSRVVLLGLGGDGKVRWERAVDVDGVAALPPLALHVDAEGRVRAAFLGRTRDTPEGLRLVSVEGAAAAAPADWAQNSRPIDVTGSIGAATIAFSEFAPGQVSRAVLVRRPEGPPVVVLDGAEPRASRVLVPADASVALVRGRQAWYAVVATRDRLSADRV